MTIRSNPPGALVYVDNHEIGTTPVSADFTYYATRNIRLIKDGYETLEVNQPFPIPWYEFPPIDFVVENLVPAEIRDERTLDFQMTPRTIVPTDHLLQRADNLRRGAGTEGFTPVAAPSFNTGPPRPLAPRPAPGSPGFETLPPGGYPVTPTP